MCDPLDVMKSGTEKMRASRIKNQGRKGKEGVRSEMKKIFDVMGLTVLVMLATTVNAYAIVPEVPPTAIPLVMGGAVGLVLTIRYLTRKK